MRPTYSARKETKRNEQLISAHEKLELIKIHSDDASGMTFDEITRDLWNISKAIRENTKYENTENEKKMIEGFFIHMEVFIDDLEKRVKEMKVKNDAAEALEMTQ